MNRYVIKHEETLMSGSRNLKTLFSLCIFCVLIAFLWLLSSKGTSQIFKSQETAQFEKQIRVTTNQLSLEKGIIPVELMCEPAELSAPNALEKLSCLIKNNTDKFITAGTLYTSVTLEKEGKSFSVSSYDTFDTFLHPDFREDHENNLIAPGRNYSLNDLPTTYDDDVVIKGINVQIDYIEFAGNHTLGPNRGGSKVISNIREGAAKYKNWLVQKYKEKGKKISALVPLLEKSQPLSEELGIQNGEQERGAILYRNYARRTYEAKGTEGLVKHLN